MWWSIISKQMSVFCEYTICVYKSISVCTLGEVVRWSWPQAVSALPLRGRSALESAGGPAVVPRRPHDLFH